MPYVALLDANIIYSIKLCDLLLRIADAGLYQPRWSEEILDEAVRNLLARVPADRRDRIERRFTAMTDAYSDASVNQVHLYLPAVPAAVDTGDRHVVAAALAGRANVIVTGNTKHFPEDSLIGVGLAVQTADEFLVHQWWLAPERVATVLRQWSDDLTNPPLTPAQLLQSLAPISPEFSALALASGFLP